MKAKEALTLLAVVDELAREHALGRAHTCVNPPEPVRVLELDLGHGCTSPRIVDNLTHDACSCLCTYVVGIEEVRISLWRAMNACHPTVGCV